jgi:hypothetical protein
LATFGVCPRIGVGVDSGKESVCGKYPYGKPSYVFDECIHKLKITPQL